MTDKPLDMPAPRLTENPMTTNIAEIDAMAGRLRKPMIIPPVMLCWEAALGEALTHVSELRDAWQRGAISENDGHGGRVVEAAARGLPLGLLSSPIPGIVSSHIILDDRHGFIFNVITYIRGQP